MWFGPRRRRFRLRSIFLLFFFLPCLPCSAQNEQDLEKTVHGKIDAAEQMLKNKQYDQAVQTLREAFPLAMQTKDGFLVAHTCLWLGTAFVFTGNEQEGQKAYDMAISLLERGGADDQVVDSLKSMIVFARKNDLHGTEMKYRRKLADTYGRLSDLKSQAEALKELIEAMDRSTEIPAICETLEKQLLPIYLKLDDRSGLATSWGAEGKCREAVHDPDGAIANYRKAIDAFRTIQDEASLAAVLDLAAENLRARGRAAEALPMQQEAVTIRKDLNDAHAYGQSLNDLSMLYQALGRLPDAVKTIEECVKITRTLDNKEAFATSLTNEASVYRDVGRFDDAFKALDEALQVSRDACLTENARTAMKIMASVHVVMGDSIKALAAEAVAENAKDICAEKKGETPRTEDKEPDWMTSHNASLTMVQMGGYSKAIDNFKAELKKAEDDHDEAATASAYDGLAYAYAESSEFTLAESSLLAAEKIYRELGNPREIAHSLANRATLYAKMGRYYDALSVNDEIQRTASSLQNTQLQIVNTLLSTADLYRRLKSYDQALDNAQQALRLSQANRFKMLAGEAQQTMGLVQLARGNYDDAASLFRESAKNDPSNTIINEGLVEVYLATNRYAEAEAELARVPQDELARADSSYRLQYYTQRGLARLGLTRIMEAVPDFDSAINEAEELRTQVLGGKSVGFLDAGSFGGRVRPYRGMVEAFGTLAVSGLPIKATIGEQETDAPSAAFHFAELTRGRSLAEKLAVSRIDEVRKQVPASLLEEEQQLIDQATQLAKKHNEEHPNSPSTPQEQEQLMKLRAAARAHLALLEKNYPLYASIFRPGTIPVGDLPLAKDEALLEYAVGIHDIFLFVVSRDRGLRCFRLPASVERMEGKVHVFRNLITAKRFSPVLARDLFFNLLGGAVTYSDLPRRLVIVPDGFLALLPFEAMITSQTGDDPSFLGTEHSISYAQSAAVLAWSRGFKRTRAAKPLFALADPVFVANDPRYTGRLPASSPKPAAETAPQPANALPAANPPHLGHTYPRLAETQTEVEALASILGVEPRPPDVLMGTSASKSTLHGIDLGAYRYLHFATHAAALGEPGIVNEPFLVLTQVANPPGDDGLLTMSEIMDLKLNSDLVVLGACDTGAGDILQGDGVASLASAFQFAGAESVVLSLWELPSEATLTFMRTFYQELKKGRSKTEAMQLGRTAMRSQYPDPYYWAVFALYSGSPE
jgi:CHAT domain-containing protein